MADSGVAVVAPMPSEQQQHEHEREPMEQDKMAPTITDSKVISRKFVASSTSPRPSPPTLPTALSDVGNSAICPGGDILNDKDKPCKIEAIQVTSPVNTEDKSNSNETISHGDETMTSGCSSAEDRKSPVKQWNVPEPKATTAEQNVNKTRKIDEIIIDGFAISAFKSWEELQDEMNERIASNLIKKRAAEKEAAANNDNGADIALKKKKSSKSSSKNSQTSTSGNSGSSLQQPKEDKVKKIKKETSKKSSNGQSSKSADSKSSTKKPKPPGDRSKENANEGTSLASRDTAERDSSHSHQGSNEVLERGSNDNSNHDVPPRPNDENRGVSSHVPQSPQVHNIRNHPEQCPGGSSPQSRVPHSPAPQRILAQDLLRDPHATANPHQPVQYLPYSNNPHLNHLYNVTSNIQHSMQAPPFNHHHNQPSFKTSSVASSSSDQSKIPQQHSQSQQQAPKQSAPAPKPAQQSQPPNSSPHVGPYQRGPMPPMHQSHPPMAASANQSRPFYHHPMHMPGPNPYLYHQQQANMSQNHSSLPPHINQQTPQSTPHNTNPYAQPPPSAPHNYGQYPGYPPHSVHHHSPSMPPYGMYPPHLPHQQPQASSMMASMSMSQLPTPYGSPYIVNETTISRQTSIIPPPMPSAFEHAAAASAAAAAAAAASRFGHHPMLPPMGAYNPAAAEAAAAAQSQAHYSQASLYRAAQSSAERSFMDLARSYNAATAAAAASSTAAPGGAGGSASGQLATYPSIMNSPAAAYAPAVPPTSATGPYSLDRWPTKMTFDHHQRAVSRYTSLYQGVGAGYPARPPTFPAGLFPPPF